LEVKTRKCKRKAEQEKSRTRGEQETRRAGQGPKQIKAYLINTETVHLNGLAACYLHNFVVIDLANLHGLDLHFPCHGHRHLGEVNGKEGEG
jgi:hypothetical protein